MIEAETVPEDQDIEALYDKYKDMLQRYKSEEESVKMSYDDLVSQEKEFLRQVTSSPDIRSSNSNINDDYTTYRSQLNEFFE